MPELEPIGAAVEVRVETCSLPRRYAVVHPSLAARLRSEHSRRFELEAITTPTGPEEITRDLPNASEDELAGLDGDGVVLPGTTVVPGTLLVGRVTPTGGELPSHEEKLLRAIFGEAAGSVRDSSLRAPPGCFGVVLRAALEPAREEEQQRAVVEVGWERPLDVGDVLLVDGEEVLVAAIEPGGAELAWSGGVTTATVTKVAMARERLHARSIGPYSVVTQQPLQGRDSFGGQRVSTAQLTLLAEHAPWVAWEMLTVKSDAVMGRARAYESLVKGQNPDVVPRGVPPAGLRVVGEDDRPRAADLFSFFEAPAARPGEVPWVEIDAVQCVAAHLSAMALTLELGAQEVGATLLSAEQIRQASHGEVQRPETLDYRSLKPEPGGLFCQRIFGPVQDYECACGKYQRLKNRGVVCEECGVEVTTSRVRRERFGHVELASPCLHPLLVAAVGTMLVLREDELHEVARGERALREAGDGGWYAPPYDGEPTKGSVAVWEALESLDLEAIDATEAGPRADLAGVLVDAGLDATALMLRVIPVLPPDLRPLVPLREGFATSHLNDLYRRLINRNARLQRLAQLDAPPIIMANERRQLQESVEQLLINGWLDRPVSGPDGKELRAMAMKADELFATRVFDKPVDYSGVAHVVADPSLASDECRVPRSMLRELFRPWAYGALEERGYVTTIKSAKKVIDQGRPEGDHAIEEVSEGYVVLLLAGESMVSRRVRAWDEPAIALDPGTASTLASREVALHVPLTHEAQLQCSTLPDRPRSDSRDGQGWLATAHHDGQLVQAAFEAAVSGSRDALDEPLLALALGRPPAALEPRAVEHQAALEHERREQVRAAITEREQGNVVQLPVNPYLARSVDELELSVRTAVALQSSGLHTIADLCRCTEADLLRTKNFGRRSLKEVKEILSELGLHLGMTDV